MEEDVAKDIQGELEQRLVAETSRLETRMQEDLELAVARKREELRASVLKALEADYVGRLAERKSRLRDRFDISFQQTIDDIEAGLTRQIEGELDRRIQHQFETYRLQREAEIGSQLARFRHDRENELRNEMESDYDTRRAKWVEQIEAEFSTREEATKRQIMAEIDARLRNERISLETSLDLVRQETALDLEVEMEQRLGEFRERKEREVVEQLERQMGKREEIMRNKALIEVRRREAEMRAEIEAALAVKRQEIKERLATLEARSEEFKQMAEARLKKDIEKDLVSDEDIEREALVAQLEEKDEASETDARLAKREAWMGALGAARSQIPAGATGTLGGGIGLGQASQPVDNALGASAMTGLNTPGLPAHVGW